MPLGFIKDYKVGPWKVAGILVSSVSDSGCIGSAILTCSVFSIVSTVYT